MAANCFAFCMMTIIVCIFIPNGEGAALPEAEYHDISSRSKLRTFNSSAVSSDIGNCSEIGKGIFEKNGSAVDAMIATMICNDLLSMGAMGMGGGFMMTIYDRESEESYFLVARDWAPLAATEDMYKNKAPNASRHGPLSIAVPGQLAGYQAAHERFGRLDWAELFTPTIEICDRGWNLTVGGGWTVYDNAETIRADPTLRKIFMEEGGEELKKPGSLVKPEKICETLKILQREGAGAFYNGTLGKMFIEDIRKRGSILTVEDLNRYRPVWKETLKTNLSDGTRVLAPNLPSSGALLAFILNVLDEFKFTPDSLKGWNNTILTYHRIIETWKYAYSVRSKMGDDLFVDMREFVRNLTSRDYARAVKSQITDDRTWNDPGHYGAGTDLHEDHGTSALAVLAPNGDAVAVTSSLNMLFGSGIASERTGILTNAGMDDFTVPGKVNHYGLAGTNKNNLIKPMKRPMSSMVPSILVSPNGDVRMVIGGAGGTRITTSVSFVIARHLWMNETIKQAIDASRFHHQVYPMKVLHENLWGRLKPLIQGLQKLGHEVARGVGGTSICGVAQIDGVITGNADWRAGGDVAGTNSTNPSEF